MAVRADELREEPVGMSRFTALDADAAGSVDENNDNATDDNSDGSRHKSAPASSAPPSYRRLHTRGTFDHTRTILVGPRGPPPGALSAQGPSSGRSGGGMSSGPLGYYVVTPLMIADGGKGGDESEGGKSGKNKTILVNRGWVPMSYIKQSQQKQQHGAFNSTDNAAKKGWSQPQGVVTVVGVETSCEQPKMFSPQHDRRTPNTLLWMDREALEERTGTRGDRPLLLTETASCAADDGNDNNQDAVTVRATGMPTFPVKPTAETVGEFKVTPATHAGYAITWFGLSGAGMVMTRKLLRRGR